MNIILLSGGSGARLWPLSNEVRSKQFLKILQSDNGNESMLERMYRMIKSIDESSQITIATSQNQVPQIKSQLRDDVDISIEPCRRDTFPAIALACSFLVKNGVSKDEAVIICPVDPLVDESYFASIKELHKKAESGEKSLCLMGIKPTYPSEKYGYIMVNNNEVVSFKEKPNEEQAKKYIEQGALWNSGVFAFKISYVLDIAEKEFGTSNYEELYNNYENLTKISFDYAVVEKESSIGYIEYEGQWMDLGTWNTMTTVMKEEASGNAGVYECNNTHVINELGIPMVVLGINDAIVAATPDGILVSDKNQSSYLKNYVKPKRPMYEKREWGEYKVLDYNIQSDGANSLTKHLIIKSNKHISHQIHNFRTEMWTIIEGEGSIVINGEIKNVKRGDSFTILPGTKHGIKSSKELHIIEVQIGNVLTEDDITRINYDWDII